ncbi:hypothetical protein GCM10007877_37640 [Marinibactrum halimedae]|uniref:Endonuclease I n=1 Tax=Marinibactrum halimedae TaxID=1444977 RepID=A0AA37TDR9_9GAMM|nr:hypothetical protein GCM10007877_37640 [Marinibactrum halimedae]
MYHTDGGVQTRLYVDGFYTYSDANLTNQWQYVSYQYSASRNGSIEVGLRFYDVSGFDGNETVFIDDYQVNGSTNGGGNTGGGNTGGGNTGGGNTGGSNGGNNSDSSNYYSSANGLSGFALKTELFNITKPPKEWGGSQYGKIWTFIRDHELDTYYERDQSVLDMYSENPLNPDPYNFTAGTHQCSQDLKYSGEGDCYNREHSMPKAWFGKGEPMHSDVHHVFPTDGSVNNKRNNHPFGEVGSREYTSNNGSLLGTGRSGLGYSGTVFEPIDEFKGDFARAHFYMATRYEDKASSWKSDSNAVFNGTGSQVFQSWYVNMLKRWHQQDPVSQKEIDRNNAAYEFQGNRNPFVDHPEFVERIW